MSGHHRSSYATPLQMLDDGRARIDCPLKGIMAIGRCREFQKDTAAAGKSCRCSVFEAYRAGEADDELPPPPTEALYGREVTRDLDEEIAGIYGSGSQGKGGMRHRAQLSTTKRSVDDEIAELRDKNRRPGPIPVADDDKEPPMTKQAKRCEKCNKWPPGNTKLWKGKCKPCREAERETAKTPKEPSKPTTIDEIAEKHNGDKKEGVAGGSGGGGGGIVELVSQSPLKERQQLIQVVAQSELDRLRRELGDARKTIHRAAWVAQGVRAGYTPVERLAEIEQAGAELAKRELVG